MMQREPLDSRSPQHPSSGTNNWGGASPMLASEIPKESLEQRYSTIRSDEIFPAHEDVFISLPQSQSQTQDQARKPLRKGFLLELIWPNKGNERLDDKLKKRRWLPKLDPKGRWPQGW
ncbi:hypothetical protein L1987_21953 [Smallanthus sonchifolius]|uniref:Uncharacterized protein n=1 Tax=Smallanthus sonchifolius TaxID=185202 RepID=A0ACB9IE47_9ASTR|nr:hypothetical protein L1987_21953 [Smallanthus sonchifolius]